MPINSILNTGLQGLSQAQSRMHKAAEGIAQGINDSNPEGINLTESLIELKAAENDARANIKIIRTATDLLGSLLDTKA